EPLKSRHGQEPGALLDPDALALQATLTKRRGRGLDRVPSVAVASEVDDPGLGADVRFFEGADNQERIAFSRQHQTLVSEIAQRVITRQVIDVLWRMEQQDVDRGCIHCLEDELDTPLILGRGEDKLLA